MLIKYKLIILHYFDIIQQKLSVVQFLLFKKLNLVQLLKYIEEKFIETDDCNNEWYHQLSHILKQMNNTKIPKLSAFYYRWQLEGLAGTK